MITHHVTHPTGMGHRGCVRIIFMGCYTDGGLYLVTILVGDRESLAGVGLIVSHTGAAGWLKALYESYRVIRGVMGQITITGTK